MASVPIGGVRVDLQLNSAAFIRDIAKSTGAMNAGVGKMTGQLAGLQKTVNTVNEAFLGFLTVRTIKQVVSFTEQCIKLAETIKGPLGNAAKDFADKATVFQNSFKLGVAEGFMQSLQQGLKDTGVSFNDLSAAGLIVGNLLGFVFTTVVNFFTHEIPEGIKTSIGAINSLIGSFNSIITKFNEWNEWLNNSAIGRLFGLAGTTTGNVGMIPLLDTSGIESSITSWVNLAAAQAASGAALQTTAEAQRLMNAAAANFHDLAALSNAAWEQAQSPMQKYEETLGRIIFLEKEHAISATTSARLTAQANSELLGTYIAGVQQATGALAGAFKENKAIQIANAVVNTAAGVVKALGDPALPFPLDFAVAASIAAAGAAQVATILSTQPGSTGGSSSKALKTPRGGGATSAAGVASTGSAGSAAAAPGQAINITLVGQGGFDKQQVRALIAQINEAVGDGANLSVAG